MASAPAVMMPAMSMSVPGVDSQAKANVVDASFFPLVPRTSRLGQWNEYDHGCLASAVLTGPMLPIENSAMMIRYGRSALATAPALSRVVRSAPVPPPPADRPARSCPARDSPSASSATYPPDGPRPPPAPTATAGLVPV